MHIIYLFFLVKNLQYLNYNNHRLCLFRDDKNIYFNPININFGPSRGVKKNIHRIYLPCVVTCLRKINQSHIVVVVFMFFFIN